MYALHDLRRRPFQNPEIRLRLRLSGQPTKQNRESSTRTP
jgi:hypothetical protein